MQAFRTSGSLSLTHTDSRLAGNWTSPVMVIAISLSPRFDCLLGPGFCTLVPALSRDRARFRGWYGPGSSPGQVPDKCPWYKALTDCEESDFEKPLLGAPRG